MSYNLQTIQSRLQRIEEYFPDSELRKIITGGVSEMKPEDIRNKDVHRGLEEGSWPRNLLQSGRVDALNRFVTAFTALEQRTEWGEWGVDSDNNAHAPIWVRLVDKLNQALLKMPAVVLPSDDAKLVRELSQRYENVKDGIKKRRENHERFERDFKVIFADEKYAELVKVIVPDAYGEVSPKHLHQFILEVKDQILRERFMTLYYEALTTHAKMGFAQKLADYFVTFMPEYEKTYVGKAPESDHQIVQAYNAIFRKAAAK